MKLIWPGTVPSPDTGRTWCFRMRSVILAPQSRQAMLNQYTHELTDKTIVSEDEIFVSIRDLCRIFGPHLWMKDGSSIRTEGEAAVFRADYRSVSIRSVSDTGRAEDNP